MKEIKFYIKFNRGDKVYLDLPETDLGIITDIEYSVSTNNTIYYVTWGAGNTTRHYEFELSSDKVF